MMRSNMPKQLMPMQKTVKTQKPKKMGGQLPAAVGKKKTDHGKMNFKKGGKVGYC